MSAIGPVHYRFIDTWDEQGLILIECRKYVPVKETPAGYWLVQDHYYRAHAGPGDWYHKCYLKWAPKVGPVRITPNLRMAELDFSNRKYRQLQIIQAQLERCRKVVSYLDSATSSLSEFGHCCGKMGE